MLELYEAVRVSRHWQTSGHDFQFEHNFITITVTRMAAAYAIATVLRSYHFSPSWQTFTALARGKTTETATEVAYFMVSD